MKSISILGSTGSIGTQALDVIRENRDKFSVSGLTAHSSIDLLIEQVREFNPSYVAISDQSKYQELKTKIGHLCEVGVGKEGIINVAANTPSDMVLSSIVGIAGLEPTYAAIQKGKDIALANKETLVTGGRLIKRAAYEKKVSMIPVDSEHSAIFQSIGNNNHSEIHKLILTASGGPFRNLPSEEFCNIKLEDALNHPNWSMGKKITIDSATMMNKGLEVIEASWLFDIPVSKIECVIHHQSVVHSMVEFIDGAVIAQLGTPNMKLPIQYAFTYPSRLPMKDVKLNLTDIGTLSFVKPDLEKFRCLKLAYECMEKGDVACIILNASNEVAVDLFLNKKIRFIDIASLIEETLNGYTDIEVNSIEDVLAINQLGREKCLNAYGKLIKKLGGV